MKALIHQFTRRYTPLQQLMWLAFGVRIIAVIFSRGFGWQDDHFLIIENTQSWVDGYHNYWLPTETEPNREPQGHALFYIGIHYYIFLFFKMAELNDPQLKMLIIRLLHALWSLLLVRYGYLLARRYGGDRAAWYTGLFLAVYWFMPFMSVRNLVELVCVPPVLIAIWLIGKDNSRAKDWLLAGLWLGVACSVRFQASFLVAGIGLVLLLKRTRIISLAQLAAGFLLVFFITQGVVDLVIWKKPFTEFMAYVDYNLNNASSYGTDNWHMYFDLVFGLLIPPLSIILVAGYFYEWRRMALLFWPVFIYFAFHTYFPNRQERFVMTVLPLIIIAGTVGMSALYEKYRARLNRGLVRGCVIFVVVINFLLLPVLSVSYSKRHRVEAMYYLYCTGDENGFIVEDSNKDSEVALPPLFYYGRWFSVCGITKKYSPQMAREYVNSLPASERPRYMVFWQGTNLGARVAEVRRSFPALREVKVIEPSLVDAVLHRLNPENIDNETAFIYRID